MIPMSKDARSSLIIVDMQNFFFREAARRRNLEQVVKNINMVIKFSTQEFITGVEYIQRGWQ